MRQAARGGGIGRAGTSTSKPGCCSNWSATKSASSGSARARAGGAGHGGEGEDARQHPGLHQRADQIDGELRIVADPPVIIPIEDLVQPGTEWEDPAPTVKKLLAAYRRTLGDQHHPVEEYRYVHAAFKMVGVGSVGTRCYIMLLLGRDTNDPLFLQIKEAQPSVLERFAGTSTYRHEGQRVVVGQRLMQAATDIFLGWQRIRGLDGVTRDYYVRQFHDWKGSADVETMLVPGPRSTRASAARPSPALTRAGATGSPSRPTSARGTPSTRPSRSSPPPTPTRTSGTTRRSPQPSTRDAWSRKPACELIEDKARRDMATKSETVTVYVAGMVQGIVLVTFPAASTVFTDPTEYDLSNTRYGLSVRPPGHHGDNGVPARGPALRPRRHEARVSLGVDRGSGVDVPACPEHALHERRVVAPTVSCCLRRRVSVSASVSRFRR